MSDSDTPEVVDLRPHGKPIEHGKNLPVIVVEEPRQKVEVTNASPAGIVIGPGDSGS